MGADYDSLRQRTASIDPMGRITRFHWSYCGALQDLLLGVAFQHLSLLHRWLAYRLAMGHTGSVSRMIGAFGKDKAKREKLSELEKMLKCDT